LIPQYGGHLSKERGRRFFLGRTRGAVWQNGADADANSSVWLGDSALPTPIVTDGSTERVGHAPKVVLPAGPQLFAERAARFEQLSRNHPLGAYLALIGRVCRAQADVLPLQSAPMLAEAARVASRAYGMPPLAAQSHERDPQWRADLAAICDRLRRTASAELEATLDAAPLADPVILYQEKDPLLDAMADDLATLSLDLLVDEQGFRRSGPNFLLHPGSSG
jgi:formate dehydrogenase maturation protein FdhE